MDEDWTPIEKQEAEKASSCTCRFNLLYPSLDTRQHCRLTICWYFGWWKQVFTPVYPLFCTSVYFSQNKDHITVWERCCASWEHWEWESKRERERVRKGRRSRELVRAIQKEEKIFWWNLWTGKLVRRATVRPTERDPVLDWTKMEKQKRDIFAKV